MSCIEFPFCKGILKKVTASSYSAVSSPQDRSKRFTRPIHSDTISASLGSIQPYAAINARMLLVHISTTVYSQVLICIQLSELEQCRVKLYTVWCVLETGHSHRRH